MTVLTNHFLPDIISQKQNRVVTVEKNVYRDCDDGCSVAVTTPNDYVFYIDKADEESVKKHKWYVCIDKRGYANICTARNVILHQYLLNSPKGLEVVQCQ